MPAFRAELDDVRAEVRRDSTGLVRLWPKVGGENALVDEDTAAAEAFGPTGTSLGALAVTETTDGEDPDEVSVLSVEFSAVGQLLGENYRVDFSYAVAGRAYVDSIPIDIVLEPWGTLGASGNDLLDECPELSEVLERQAQRTGVEGRDASDQAATHLVGGLREVRARMRKQVLSVGGLWPAYIVDREGLRGVLVATAITKAFFAEGLRTETLIQLHQAWISETEKRWQLVAPLAFGETAKVEQATVITLGSVRRRRTQG